MLLGPPGYHDSICQKVRRAASGEQMAIWTNLDGHDHTNNFDRANLGPGVYVLFQGRISDNNIVYIGKSTVDVLMRVSHHTGEKEFDRVGVILPAHRDAETIHNLEHLEMQEFLDRFGERPLYNIQIPRLLAGSRVFDWHTMRRRRRDVAFL